MSHARRGFLTLGAVGVLLAGALLAVDGNGVTMTTTPTLTVVVPVVFALVSATLVVGLHWADGVRQSAIVPPERGTEAPPPGAELRLLDGGRWPVLSPTSRRTVRDRLRAVTVRTVARDRGVSRSRAERAVDEGTWTDDPVAAALFTPVGERPLSRIDAALRFRTRARRAARATVRLADGTTVGDDG